MVRRRKLERFIETVKALPELITEIDESLWAGLVDNITVYSKDRIEIVFRFQQEIEEMLRLVESAVVKNEKEETVCAS